MPGARAALTMICVALACATAAQARPLSPGGRLTRVVQASAPGTLVVRARSSRGCAARLAVALDGGARHLFHAGTRGPLPLLISLPVAAGRHRVTVSFPGAPRHCANGLRILGIVVRAAGSNPFASTPLYVEPDTHAARQAQQWQASRPADAQLMRRISQQPQAVWFGDWTADPRGDVSALVTHARAQGRLPVLVAYDLPGLDCGGYSAGGATSDSAYRSWIRELASGIGPGPAAVILEPDALAEIDCLPADRQAAWYGLLDDALGVLAAGPATSVYVDAGNSAWQDAATIAGRLSRLANLRRARGFSLNVSNFQSTADSLAYGDAIAARLPGTHFVVDTSRNGAGPAAGDAWCNPAGRALGPAPTSQTGDPLADALLWVKAPGESDGTCAGGPAAGDWWADYALGLARRAGP